VVLPILWKPEGYAMLTASDARKQGYLGLAEWLEQCEGIWKEKQGEKAGKMTIYQRLDRYHGLTQQRRRKYTVVYPDVNRVMFASVLVGNDTLPATEEEGQQPNRFIAENAMYYADTEDKGEAFFLASWLNSPIIDQMLQSFRRKEQAGHPHVHKKVWEFPIPSYDPSSAKHRSMASLGEDCAQVVKGIVLSVTSKGDRVGLMGLRNRIREELKDRIAEIDALAGEILQGIEP
jgi:hypothetical protein